MITDRTIPRCRFANEERIGGGTLVPTTEYLAQILEGSPAAIEERVDSIHRDMRHDHVTVLRSGPISRRWSLPRSPRTMSGSIG